MITTTWYQGLSEPARELREAVFVRELGYAPEQAAGSDAWVVVLFEGDTPLATGALDAVDGGYRLECIAVAASRRGEHLGDLVTRLLLFKAQQLGSQRIFVCATPHAAPYYARFGFEAQPSAAADSDMETDGMHIIMAVRPDDVVFPRECDK